VVVSRDAQIERVIRMVEEREVKFVEIWFSDILGFLKSFTIPKEMLENAFSEGMGFDGSSVLGFTRIDESDMVAIPDPSTFAILPWRAGRNGVARMFCDIYLPDGTPFEGDPRYILKRNLEMARELGFTAFMVGPEMEYFYFKDSKSPEVLDRGGYFDLIPRDEAIDLRRQTVLALESMGIEVEYTHHEVAPSQHEIDVRYADALRMADIVMTLRLTVKEIARVNGFYATFMPKPIFGENGSGMHVHMSLFKGSNNAFYDPNGRYGMLSDDAIHFIGGLLSHAKEITAVTCQWVNSYKRLVPGYEAPVYISWARRNRSDLIRVPMYKPGKELATRIEYRSPDPAVNPYLAFAVMLAAGIDGIRNGIEPPEPVEKNVYEMSEEERRSYGIGCLPGSLIEAIYVAQESRVVKEALGEHTFKQFIDNKLIEWDKYRVHVTQYEVDRYLPLL